MSAVRVPVAVGEGTYDVVVGTDLLEDLTAHVPPPAGAAAALLVTQQPLIDTGVAPRVQAALRAAGLAVHQVVIEDGEAAKRAEVLAGLWQAAASVPLSRGDLVVAVGGGVVGDLAGFAAATYNRGMAVLQVPTTLLAQVDAAIGGKTGINLTQGKNLVGAFHQPIGVLCDVGTLATLPPRIRTEGLAEVVKYGLIHDPELLDLLEELPEKTAPDADLLQELVRRSAAAKARFVAADTREAGIRAHLNLGHTYGHAVETLAGYGRVLHGEAVAIGTVVALHLGHRLGTTPMEVVQRGEALLARLGLPTRAPALDRDRVWEVMARDKKAAAGAVRFVVLDALASPRVLTPSRADVDAVLDGLAAGQ